MRREERSDGEGRREEERREMRDWGGEKGLGKGEGRERKEGRRKE